MKLKIFFCQFPNPWALRLSGMGCYASKWKKAKITLMCVQAWGGRWRGVTWPILNTRVGRTCRGDCAPARGIRQRSASLPLPGLPECPLTAPGKKSAPKKRILEGVRAILLSSYSVPPFLPLLLENWRVEGSKDRRIETMNRGEFLNSTSLFFLNRAGSSLSTRYFQMVQKLVLDLAE